MLKDRNQIFVFINQDKIMLKNITVWTPRIVLPSVWNEININKEVQLIPYSNSVRIFVPLLLMKSNCVGMNFASFPFDVQTCKLAILCNSETIKEVNFVMNTEKLKPEITEEFDVHANVIAGGKQQVLPEVTIEFTLTRKFMSHLISEFLPSGLFVVISWMR